MKNKSNNRLDVASTLAPMQIPQSSDPSIFDTGMWEILSPQPPGSEQPSWSGASPLPSPYAGPPTGEDSNIRRRLRKTKVCKHFLKGRCHYGVNCTFAHYGSELFKKPNLAKTKMCAKPNCTDPECTYAHSSEELRQPGEASDMDTARVDIEHEKVLGEQRALLTVHSLIEQQTNVPGEYNSPAILPSPSLLPTPLSQRKVSFSAHSKSDNVHKSLHALAVQNEELRQQVERSNTVLAHLLQIASAQAVPETPNVVNTPQSNIFSQQRWERGTASTDAIEGGQEGTAGKSRLRGINEESVTNPFADISLGGTAEYAETGSEGHFMRPEFMKGGGLEGHKETGNSAFSDSVAL